jgi:hypothetical protein
MIARKRYNNDTAYFQEQGKNTPVGARLNDIVGGRFRVASISASEVVLEDVSLGFRHKLALYRPAPGQTAASGNNPNDQTFPSYNPSQPVYSQPQTDIPGIPNNIPRYIPPTPTPKSDDEDDDGDN